MDMSHVRPPTDGFTNQRVLNIENAKKVYKTLRKKHIVVSSWITFHPMFYKDPNGGTREVKWFKGVGPNDCFFQCFESMPEDPIEEKKQCFFNSIIWELVDEKYVEHVCNILAKNDLLCRSLSQANFDKIFLYQRATIVLYDNEITFFFS